jgi:hypothetical protein
MEVLNPTSRPMEAGSDLMLVLTIRRAGRNITCYRKLHRQTASSQ